MAEKKLCASVQNIDVFAHILQFVDETIVPLAVCVLYKHNLMNSSTLFLLIFFNSHIF